MSYEMEELAPIVAELARKYTGGESTSITYEKAQMLMEGVIYCLNEYQSAPGSLVGKDMTVEEQYSIGVRLVTRKASEVRQIYNEMSEYFDSYGVLCLRDTVQKGIPEFLKWYDVAFCPQNTLLTLDYPVFRDLHTLTGVDAIYEYICAVRIEQRFLRKWDRMYIQSILQKANPGYRHMVDNVCSIVLTNLLGHMIIGKPIREKGFRKEDFERIYQWMSGFCQQEMKEPNQSLEEWFREGVKQMVDRFYGNDRELLEYLLLDITNIAVRVRVAVQNEHLEKVFVW